MATFDAVTYSSLMALKEPIGAPILVPNNFTSDKYVDTGKAFDSAAFPKLAEIYGTDVDPTVVSVVDLPSSMPQLKVTASALSRTPSAFEEMEVPPAIYPPVFLENGSVGLAIEAGVKYDSEDIPPSNVSYSGYVMSDHVNLLRTTDQGSTWEHFTVGFGETCVIFTKVHASKDNFFIFGHTYETGTQLRTFTASSGDGVNWNVNVWNAQYSNGTALNYPTSILYTSVSSENKIYMSLTGPSVYYSTDFGASFAFILTGSSSFFGLRYTALLTFPYYFNYVNTVYLYTDTIPASMGNNPLTAIELPYRRFGSNSSRFTSTLETFSIQGAAETRNAIVMYTRDPLDPVDYDNETIGFISPDRGLSWKRIKFPYTLSSYAKINSIGELFVIQTGATDMLLSNDGEVWRKSSLPQISPDSQILPWQLPSYATKNSVFYGGLRATHLSSKLLKISDTVNVVPYMESPTLGAKWVVRAK